MLANTLQAESSSSDLQEQLAHCNRLPGVKNASTTALGCHINMFLTNDVL
jgi:hypothetical protein